MRKGVVPRLFIIGGLVLAVAGCVRPAPTREFTIDDLLINQSVFPAGWYTSAPPAPVQIVDGAIIADESIKITFTVDDPDWHTAGLEIYRFSSEYGAAREYRSQLSVLFNSRSTAALTPWETPAELSYESPVANQSHFACGRSSITGKMGCRFLGQYDEYLVVFASVVGPRMDFADLERILQAIDGRMAHYLTEDIE